MLAMLLLLATPDPAPPAAAVPACTFDRGIFELAFAEFDQDERQGWRAIAAQPGCDGKAADVIRAYRMNQETTLSLLYFHEGQLRAFAGDSAAAIPLLERSRRRLDGVAAWPPYVDATIAFLRGDRRALLAARATLLTVPKPEDWPADGAWPQNLDVVDGLIACLGKPYKVAYGAACRPKP